MSKKTRQEPHEEHADESWLIPYADLMTLLLALFIVLYGMSATDAKKFEEMSEAFSSVLTGGIGVLDQNSFNSNSKSFNSDNLIPKDSSEGLMRKNELMRREQENLEGLKKRLDDYIKENGLTTQLDTQLNHSRLMITISDNALFASGDAEVKTEARKLAKAISAMLEQFPDYEVVVSGHTDNIPISTSQFPSNWDLSSGRALNFMKILLLNDKLDPKKFSSTGQGEYHPVASNNTSEGRAKNRRVEVSIIRKYQEESKTGIPAINTTSP